MLTEQQFFDFFDAALTFFATIGTIVTVNSAIYALIAKRRVNLAEQSAWDYIGLAVNVGIADGFLLGTPLAVLMLILGRGVVSS